MAPVGAPLAALKEAAEATPRRAGLWPGAGSLRAPEELTAHRQPTQRTEGRLSGPDTLPAWGSRAGEAGRVPQLCPPRAPAGLGRP